MIWPRITIAGLMWSILATAFGMAVFRAILLMDPEVRKLVALLLLVLLGWPVFAFGVAAIANSAFAPALRAGTTHGATLDGTARSVTPSAASSEKPPRTRNGGHRRTVEGGLTVSVRRSKEDVCLHSSSLASPSF